MRNDDRNKLIAQAACWMGWTLDRGPVIEGLPELRAFLKDVRAQMQGDSNEISWHEHRGEGS
jgi:hypothetical protein